MTQYNEHLNQDSANVKTSAKWDASVSGWVHDSIVFIKNDNGDLEIVGPTNPLPTKVMGSTVVVDGTTYQVSGGNTLRGTDAIKPDPVLAHAAIPYCFYLAIDTGVVEATDGTNWVRW